MLLYNYDVEQKIDYKTNWSAREKIVGFIDWKQLTGVRITIEAFIQNEFF